VIHLLTFATQRYEHSRQRLVASAQQFGKFNIWSYSDKDFRLTDAYSRFPKVTRTRRGAGLWLWKPYYILSLLNNIKEGEYLIYLDAGIEIVKPLDQLLELSKVTNGVALFTVHKHLNKYWTKRDCFTLMGCDSREYLDTEQSMSGIIVLKKNDFVMRLISEWYTYNTDVRIVSDLPNTSGLPNYEGFIENRHDQSILNNLRVKYGLPSYVDPTQYGEPYRASARAGVDDYPTLLNLHRERLPSWHTAIKLMTTDRNRFVAGSRMHIARLYHLIGNRIFK
jgi:hypothetical protein